jgi:hypothetical protein
VGARFSAAARTGPGANQTPVQWVPGLSRGKKRPGRDGDPSPLLVPWSLKGRAIPLLPLRVVRPVQSLSACTGVHFTFFLSYNNQQSLFFTLTANHMLVNTLLFHTTSANQSKTQQRYQEETF